MRFCGLFPPPQVGQLGPPPPRHASPLRDDLDCLCQANKTYDMARACCCLEPLDAEEEQEPLLGRVEPSDVALVTPPHIGYRQVLAAGAQKAKVPLTKSVPLGILAGIFIAFGCYLMVSVGANCPEIKEKNPGLQP